MGDIARRLITYPAADRNKTFIFDVIRRFIPSTGSWHLLEVASGTGQHAEFIASHIPNVTIQPTEVDESLLDSIQTKNMENPIELDVHMTEWPVDRSYDFILNVNMFHVAPPRCATNFFKNGTQVLKTGGFIFTYGPYAVNGQIEPQSNRDFDRNLKLQHPTWGLRDIEDLKQIASKYNIHLKEINDLPANNKCLVWQKE